MICRFPSAEIWLLLSIVLAPQNIAARQGGVSMETLAQGWVQPEAGGGELPFGGISGLAYDKTSDTWMAVSDDYEHPRVYRMRVTITGDSVTVTIIETIHLRGQFRDAEAIRLEPSGNWLISFEVPPAVVRYNRAFEPMLGARLPEGVQDRVTPNKAFEALTLWQAPGQMLALAITEHPICPDPEAVRWCGVFGFEPTNLQVRFTGRYDPEPAPTDDSGAVGETGVTELVTLPDGRLITMEVSKLQGAYNTTWYQLEPNFEDTLLSFSKTWVADTRSIVPGAVGKLEAMSVGPPLTDRAGGYLLLALTDDDFGRHGDLATQVIAFRMKIAR